MAEGWHFFHCMTRDYCLKPRVEHYAFMVDLLGQAGLLHEAKDFIKRMPKEPSALVWHRLHHTSRIHGNVEMGKYEASRIFEQELYDVATCVMLSNIYTIVLKTGPVITGTRRFDQFEPANKSNRSAGL